MSRVAAAATLAVLCCVVPSGAHSLPCPPAYTCFGDGATFADAVNATCAKYKKEPDGFMECVAWRPAKLALLCNETEPCIIAKTRLNIGVGVSVIMKHVQMGPNEFSLAAGD